MSWLKAKIWLVLSLLKANIWSILSLIVPRGLPLSDYACD
jgi:hypothetical protein